MPLFGRRRGSTRTGASTGTFSERMVHALRVWSGRRREDGSTNLPLTYLTDRQAVSLLESVEPLGGRRALLDVDFDDGSRKRLSSPAALAELENLDDVEQITQVTRFRGQGEHILIVDWFGITNIHDGMEDATSPACTAVLEEYRRLRLRRTKESPTKWLLYPACVVPFLLSTAEAGAVPGRFEGWWLIALLGLSSVLSAAIFVAIMAVAEWTRPHWLQRGRRRYGHWPTRVTALGIQIPVVLLWAVAVVALFPDF